MTRRRLVVAALLSTTFLTQPDRAEAAPVFGFLSNLVVGAAATGFFGTAVATFATSVVGQALIQVGVSYLAKMLEPKPKMPKPSERFANYEQPISYREFLFGEARKGGPKAFTAASGGKRHYAVIIAGHPTVGPITHYLDNFETTTNAEGFVNSAPIGNNGSIRTFNGADGQAADALLVSTFPEWTEQHDMAKLSGAYIYARRPKNGDFSEVYPRGREWDYNPVWRGWNEIYDPRTDTRGWTDNFALCFAHFLVEVMGLEVDWPDVAIEADVCDEDVTNKEGGVQKRWTCNGTIDDSMDFEDVRALFAAAADLFVFERPDGKVGFRVGRWMEPTLTLTPADFWEVHLSEGPAEPAPPNEFVAEYVEPSLNWVEAPSGTYVHDPAGRRTRRTPALYLVNSHNQACRVLKRMARQTHARYQVRGVLKLVGHEMRAQTNGGRFVRYVDADLGLDIYLETNALGRRDGLSFDFEAASVEPEDFDFVAATEEPDRPERGKVASDTSIETLAGFSGIVQSGAGGVAGIRWSWNAPDNDGLTTQLRYRRVEDPAGIWLSVDVPEETTAHVVTGLVDGALYEAQARFVAAEAGRQGEWAPVSPLQVTAVANTTAPAPLASITATTPNAVDAEITFTAPQDDNFRHADIYRAVYTTGTDPATADFADATLVAANLYALPGMTRVWTDAAAPSGLLVYWGVAENASGVGTTPGVSAHVTI